MMSDPGGDSTPVSSLERESGPPALPADPPAAPRPTVLKALEGVLGDLEKAARRRNPVDMVHDARKAMKAYRGLLRLVPTAGAAAARRETAAAARSLSAARDRAAALESLAALEQAGFLSIRDRAVAAAAIGDDPAEDGAEAEGHRAEIAAFLDTARARLADGLGEEAAQADVVEGLTLAYRKARRASFDTPLTMHEARKRVITHRYQMSFIASAFSGCGADRAGSAQALRDLLGAYQDIETLRPMLEAARAILGEEVSERLAKAMAARQKELRRDAIALHGQLFRRRPRAFARTYRNALSP